MSTEFTTVKVTPSFLARVEQSPNREHFLFAFRRIYVLRNKADESYREGRKKGGKKSAYVERTDRLYAKYPQLNAKRRGRKGGALAEHLHRPIELFWGDRFCPIPGYAVGGGKNSAKATAFYREGQQLGLWYFIPCNPKNCHKGTWENRREHALIVLRNWGNEELIDVTIEGKCLAKRKAKEREQSVIIFQRQADSLTLLEAHRHAETRTTYPTSEQLRPIAVTMVENHEMNKKGKPYLYVLGPASPDDNPLNLSGVINNFILQRESPSNITGKDSRDGNGNLYPNRIYTSAFNLTAKWIRRHYLFDGERIVECDLTALHPNIIAADYRETTGKEPPALLTGDSHTKITEAINLVRAEESPPPLTRKEVKQSINLSFWNCQKKCPEWWAKKDKATRHLFQELIERQCPGFMDWHECRNKELSFLDDDTGDQYEDHRQTSRLLNFWEVRLMAHAVRLLRTQSVTVDSSHDALWVAASNDGKARDALNAACVFFRIETKAS